MFGRLLPNAMLFVSFILLVHGTTFAQQDEDISQQADRVDILLERAGKHQNRDSSSYLAKEAYDMVKGTQAHGSFCLAALQLAENAMADRRPLDALRYYIEAADRTRHLRDIKLINKINLGLADLYKQEHVYKSALEMYKKALMYEPQNRNIKQLIGDTWLLEGEVDSAIAHYEPILREQKAKGDYATEVRFFNKLIEHYSLRGQKNEVLRYYLLIEEILEKQGTPSEKALLYNNLGKLFLANADYSKSLAYLKKAELQCEYTDCMATDAMKVNMAVCLFNTGQTRESIHYLLSGIELLQKKKDWTGLAHAEEILTGIYFNSNDLFNAQIHNRAARTAAQRARDFEALARSYQRAADIHFELYDYEEAIDFYKLYLSLTDSLRFQDKVKIELQGELKSQIERSERETKSLIYSQEIRNLTLRETELEKQRLSAENRTLALEARQKEEALLQLEERRKLTEAELRVAALEALKAQQDLRMAAQASAAERRQKEDAVKLHAQEIEAKNQEALAAKQRQELELLQRDNAINALTLKENANFRKFAILGGTLLLTILGLLAAGWVYSRKANNRLNAQNKAIEEQKTLIEAERQRSDRLLLNILPSEVADELKQYGHATPRTYENVSVLFTDFEGFTRITAEAPPDQVLDELNTCFLAFDQICEQYNLEKIKTIGDAYMAAAGVPQTDEHSAVHAAKAGLAMLQYLQERIAQNPNVLLHKMRVGIHTGTVVAGVVGKNKFAYDIWGDTVNTASRMEEFGEPGRVNVSESTAQLLGKFFKLHDRGLLQVHNKGQLRMFFIEP